MLKDGPIVEAMSEEFRDHTALSIAHGDNLKTTEVY